MFVRILSAADAKAWHSIRKRMLTEHPESFGSDASDFEETTVDMVADRIRHCALPHSLMYGAFERETLVGTVGFFQDGGPKREHLRVIWGMYVAPEARRQRIGAALLNRALTDLRQLQGVQRVALDVSCINAGALALYAACGFEVYGIEPESMLVGGKLLDVTLMSLRL